jgi:hypothetical protein
MATCSMRGRVSVFSDTLCLREEAGAPGAPLHYIDVAAPDIRGLAG